MSIDANTAAKVAKLARIEVENQDLTALAKEFNDILGFIEQLNEVDVSGVDRKSTRLNSSHSQQSRMPSSA